MILVDSSVWIDGLRGPETRVVALLRYLVENGEAAVGDLILAEVLQGCRTDREFDQVRRGFEPIPLVMIAGRDVAVAAARNYRHLRAKGSTPRKTIDTLIATRCLMDRMPLLYTDRDFDPFVKHLGLMSAMDTVSGVI